MSHFTVLVVGEDPEKQLAPYDENMQVPEYVREEVNEEEKQRFLKYYVEDKKKIGADVSFEEAYTLCGEDWNNSSWRKDEDGVWKEYTTYNPKSKWDWYSLGGRWTGYFKLKPLLLIGGENGFGSGEIATLKKLYDTNKTKFARLLKKYKGKEDEILALVDPGANPVYPSSPVVGEPGLMTEKAEAGYADQCRVDEIDIASMQREAIEKAELNWLAAKDKDQADRFFVYGIDKDTTYEQYINCRTSSFLSTFAVVKDGVWYEKGKMGWWGIVTDKKVQDDWNAEFYKMFNSLAPDTLVSVYDCHI
jgi:hypothetical protein